MRARFRRVGRGLVLWLGLLAAPASGGVFVSEHIEAYPADWPELAPTSGDCGGLEGEFLDPDRWRWEREEANGAKYGGTREAAWLVFGFAPQAVRVDDGQRAARHVRLGFTAAGELVVTYLLDGAAVAQQLFEPARLRCTPAGLQVLIQDNHGQVLDKLPNSGRLQIRITLQRSGEFLYVRQVAETQARVLGVIPQSFLRDSWFRFPRRQP